MGRLGSILLKELGVAALAVIVLGVIGTLVSIVLSVVTTVVALVIAAVLFGVFLLALVGLISVLSDDSNAESEPHATVSTTAREATGPEDRLRSRYVDGELNEAEFERQLDRLLESDDRRADRVERTESRRSERTRR